MAAKNKMTGSAVLIANILIVGYLFLLSEGLEESRAALTAGMDEIFFYRRLIGQSSNLAFFSAVLMCQMVNGFIDFPRYQKERDLLGIVNLLIVIAGFCICIKSGFGWDLIFPGMASANGGA